jgi:hypothetical protein
MKEEERNQINVIKIKNYYIITKLRVKLCIIYELKNLNLLDSCSIDYNSYIF